MVVRAAEGGAQLKQSINLVTRSALRNGDRRNFRDTRRIVVDKQGTGASDEFIECKAGQRAAAAFCITMCKGCLS